MTDELKPCAHCGSTEVEGMLAFSSPTEYFVGCNECHAQSALYDDPKAAIAAWNRRDHSHIEVTDAMVEAAVVAYHADDPFVLQEEGNHWLVDGMRLALTAALNVKEG